SPSRKPPAPTPQTTAGDETDATSGRARNHQTPRDAPWLPASRIGWANGLPSTGYVGPLTIAVLNKGELPITAETTTTTKSSGLTSAQVSAVISLMQSFNVDAATIAKVKVDLGQ
ncbi:MAG TPA: hypothetical protein VM755_16705, partial [Stellaceae bacterium]|nr:hypothetical protein [Stellaceae bacterium]